MPTNLDFSDFILMAIASILLLMISIFSKIAYTIGEIRKIKDSGEIAKSHTHAAGIAFFALLITIFLAILVRSDRLIDIEIYFPILPLTLFIWWGYETHIEAKMIDLKKLYDLHSSSVDICILTHISDRKDLGASLVGIKNYLDKQQDLRKWKLPLSTIVNLVCPVRENWIRNELGRFDLSESNIKDNITRLTERRKICYDDKSEVWRIL